VYEDCIKYWEELKKIKPNTYIKYSNGGNIVYEYKQDDLENKFNSLNLKK
jgi:hypothetical protein